MKTGEGALSIQKLRLLAASVLCLMLVGCVSGKSSSGRNFSNLYAPVLGCSVKFSLTHGANSAIQKCDRQINTYVNKLLNQTKRDNGWKSVKPSVRPAVKAHVIKKTLSILIKKYGFKK